MTADPGGRDSRGPDSGGPPRELAALLAEVVSDEAAVPNIAAIRREGGRLRRWRRAGRAVSTVVGSAVVAALVAAALTQPAPPPPLSMQARPMVGAFQSLAEVSREDFGGADTRTGVAAALGDAGYVAWLDGGQLRVAAVDLRTGESLWPPRAVGEFASLGMVVADPRGVMVAGYRGGDAASDDLSMVMLDPMTGAVRWRATYGPFLAARLDDTLVVVSEAGRLTEGRDYATGTVRWSRRDRIGSTSTGPMVRAAALAGPGSDTNPAVNGGLMLQVGGDHVVWIYQTNGTAGRTWPVAGTEVIGADGRVYVSDRKRPVVEVFAIDGGEPHTFYAAADSAAELHTVLPCGADLMCLVEVRRDGGGVSGELVAVSLATGEPRWRQPSGELLTLLPMGGNRVLAENDHGQTVLFGPTGAQTLETGPGYVLRIDASHALVVGPSRSTPAAIEGLVVGDGVDVKPLGMVDATGSCAANDRMLLCPTRAGYAVWRFAS